jgi:hypothetical protein
MSDTVKQIPTDDFLRDLFGEKYVDVWVCSVSVADMEANRGWTGGRLYALAPQGDRNNYFCIGELTPEANRRANDDVFCHRLVIADDVGTKVPLSKWEALFAMGYPRPRWVVQTSPGNFTFVWKLAVPATKGAQRERWVLILRQTMVRLGLTDNVQDPARYIRLPNGVNSKKKYGPVPVPVGVVPSMSSPGESLSVEKALDVLLGVGWETKTDEELGLGVVGGVSHSGALTRTADLAAPDQWMRLGIELGMELKQTRPGVVDALCPNIAAHGDRADTGFAFLGNGLCECMHAHCQGLKVPDFHRMMVESFDARQAAREALGMLGAGEAKTADEFLARCVFGEDGAEAGDETTVADEVERIAAGVVRAEQDKAAALDALVQRFVYVERAGVMFDRETRERHGRDTFAALGCVVGVIPAGASGAKHAWNVVLNHTGLARAATFAPKPGDLNLLVDVASPTTGQTVRAVNTWSPSFVRSVKGVPSAFLEHIGNLVPDKEVREFLIKWMANVARAGRTAVMPVLLGKPGVGKDLLIDALVQVMGPHNCEGKLNEKKIMSEFNGWREKQLLIWPEGKLTRRETWDEVKDLTSGSARWVTINHKFQNPYQVECCNAVLMATNSVDALPHLDPQDRRVMLYEIPVERVEGAGGDAHVFGTENYFTRIKAALLDPMQQSYLAWYLREGVDLTGFNPFAPAPDFNGVKAAMMSETLPSSSLWVMEQLSPGGALAGRMLVTTRELEQLGQSQGGDVVRRSIKVYDVRRGLELAGWKWLGRFGSVRAGKYDTRINLWLSPEDKKNSCVLENSLKNAHGNQALAAYEADVNRVKSEKLQVISQTPL